MKAIALMVLLFSFAISARSEWKNGGQSQKISVVKFGTHDWILWKAYLIAEDHTDLEWLDENINYAFFGTEVPDVGKKKLSVSFRNQIIGNYKDTSPCHCVLYDDDFEVFQPFAATRVTAEFQKAKDAIAQEKWKLAAFYIGAMAHYVGDVSQFMHLMGRDSRWNGGEPEDQTIHAAYETVFENRVDFTDRSLNLLEPFISEIAITGNTPESILYEVAAYTDTGNSTAQDTGWMYDQIMIYKTKGWVKKPEKWDPKFLDQSGKNVNKAVNALAKLLIMVNVP